MLYYYVMKLSFMDTEMVVLEEKMLEDIAVDSCMSNTTYAKNSLLVTWQREQ